MVMHVTVQPGESTLYHTHSHDRIAIGLSDSTIAQQEWDRPEESPPDQLPAGSPRGKKTSLTLIEYTT